MSANNLEHATNTSTSMIQKAMDRAILFCSLRVSPQLPPVGRHEPRAEQLRGLLRANQRSWTRLAK